ncbi:MAG: polyprenyl synthetase family protein [Myxococcales bacterium]
MIPNSRARRPASAHASRGQAPVRHGGQRSAPRRSPPTTPVALRPSSTLVRDVLREYGALANTRVRKYLHAPEGTHRHPLYDLAADYPGRGGRALRASLCIATARAFGAAPEDAVNSAAALEMMHNAFLVHDDVEDDSEERRGLPTLHVLHGVPIAINVGDALAVMSLRPLIDNRASLGPRVSLRILEEAERMARESVEGQAIELAWRRDNVLALAEEDYLRMILKKTCWYTIIYPVRVGALIGTRDGIQLDPFVRFGFFVGAAFQIQDDLLNLIGDKRRYGKELDGDLWEGKRTLMVIRLLNEATPTERERVVSFLALPRHEKQKSEVRWIRERMDAHRCVDYAREVAHGLAGAALHEFSQVFAHLPDTRDKQFLQSLAVWALDRA